jgi:WhiB family transcriptional regulator, redox-sensing transcriptional regulator
LSIGTSWRGINPLLSHSLEEEQHMLTTVRNHWNELDWRETATCRDLDPELFFPVGVTGMAIEQIDAAKAFCNTCESKEACLEFAITTNQEYGVWGATTEDERRVLRRVWRAEVRRQRVAS